MNFFLRNQLVRVSNTFIRLTLIVHQGRYYLIPVDATSLIDDVDFIHHHPAILLTIFTHHPHGDTNADFSCIHYRRHKHEAQSNGT